MWQILFLTYVNPDIFAQQDQEFNILAISATTNQLQVKPAVFNVQQENIVTKVIPLHFKIVLQALIALLELDTELNSFVLKELILTQQEMMLLQTVSLVL